MSGSFPRQICRAWPSAASIRPSIPATRFTSNPAIQSCLRHLTTGAATQPRKTISPISRAPSSPPTKTPDELSRLPYVVRRTSSIQLPVYRRFTSGGTRQVVLIKKVDGDRRKLLDDLVESMGIDRDNIRINPTTQHVELKGDYYEKAKSWLLERGF